MTTSGLILIPCLPSLAISGQDVCSVGGDSRVVLLLVCRVYVWACPTPQSDLRKRGYGVGVGRVRRKGRVQGDLRQGTEDGAGGVWFMVKRDSSHR